MKKLFISTAFVLAIASFGSAAYGNVDVFNKGVCQIPPRSTTGGGTRVRLEAIRKCDRAKQHSNKGGQLNGQQAPSTLPITLPNPPATVPSPYLQQQQN